MTACSVKCRVVCFAIYFASSFPSGSRCSPAWRSKRFRREYPEALDFAYAKNRNERKEHQDRSKEKWKASRSTSLPRFSLATSYSRFSTRHCNRSLIAISGKFTRSESGHLTYLLAASPPGKGVLMCRKKSDEISNSTIIRRRKPKVKVRPPR